MELVQQGIDLFMSEKCTTFRTVATVVGSLVLLRFSLKFLCNACSLLRAYLLAPLGIGRTNLKSYGKWAVVTGASEGIGRGYALELARRGLNVVIMSRSQAKLDKVADEIREIGREVRVVPVDFSFGDIYPGIAESIQDLEIGVLVNNVGYSSEYPDEFLDVPVERMHKMVDINIQSMVHMCHIVMPQMVARGKGVVINLSSASAIKPTVMLLAYATTKKFVDCFSETLSLEYASKGIIVQNVAPFFVATAMSGIRRSSLIVADAKQFARAALNTVGILSYTQGTLSHTIQGFVVRSIPLRIYTMANYKMLTAAKAQYLKRAAKAK